MMGNGSDEHCAFVLLAEFDIDRGAQLTYQFPQPLGTDEGLLAHLMLPDGAERQLDDWTIFFLNQTPFNRISPVLALESESKSGDEGGDEDGGELLYVLNLVRTKLDQAARRGAVVKAMAICTRHPFIHVFKPVLLMALDDYFLDPSQECLARLFDAVNAMDMSNAPALTRDEKLVMRVSERKDIFIEKFTPPTPGPSNQSNQALQAKRPSQSSIHAQRDRDRDALGMHPGEGGSRTSLDTGTATGTGPARTTSQNQSRSRADSLKSHKSAGASEASGPTSLGGSTIWVGEDGMLAFEGLNLGDLKDKDVRGQNQTVPHAPPQKGRRSIDSNSTNSHVRKEEPTIPLADMNPRGPKDTHFYTTSIIYRGIALPTKVPLSTFPEEVGDYSLISLIQDFSSATTTVVGPQHPHLHTNGERTHPVILLFNALITNKRIIFLGYQRPAGKIASMVLAACALGSGCGAVMRGFISRAFPYANLTNRDEWEEILGFIAGVTNPIFKSGGSWDVLCELSMNGVGIIVNKDIHTSWPVSSVSSAPPWMGGMTRTGTIRGEAPIGIGGSEEEVGRMSTQINAPLTAAKTEFSGKSDSSDNLFMEDIVNAISWHFGETLIRARFTDYVQRFVRLAARYEEEYLGSTKIGHQTTSFDPHNQQLGSGSIFPDDIMASREVAMNAYRIEGWRRTQMYEYYLSDFQNALQTKPIQGFDVYHQIAKLKTARNMTDQEAELIMRTLAENAQTYDQVVELLSLLPQYLGGLLPLTFGLFHQQDAVRNHTVDLLTTLRLYPLGVQFLQSLNHFHRYAFVRQAHAREIKQLREQNPNALLSPPLPNMASWTPSNRSETSLGGN